MKKIIVAILIAAFIISIVSAFLVTRHARNFALGEKVALIRIHGTISLSDDAGLFGEDRATPRALTETLERAEGDGSVKAILVEINSPGGSVVASEEMAIAIKEAKKPVVCWLGEIATSGGYYIASACDLIVADRATITGSLGVLSVFPEYSRLLEKIGVNMTVVKAGEFKDFSSGFRPMTEEERRMMEEVVEETYETFLADVAANRNLSLDRLRTMAEGRIYTGQKAKELGLVDEIGSRRDAVDWASKLGGIKGTPSVVEYRRGTFLREFVGAAAEGLGYGLAKGIVENSLRLE